MNLDSNRHIKEYSIIGFLSLILQIFINGEKRCANCCRQIPAESPALVGFTTKQKIKT